MNIDFPFHISGHGRTATTDDEDHIRDMIEQVLFTSPGERLNRPAFGNGLMKLVFEPNSDLLASAVQANVQAALQQWLAELILVEAVQVTNQDALLQVEVRYIVRRTQQRQIAQFRRIM